MEIVNKKARMNYRIFERFEAGVELTGSEVKSIRAGQVSLESAHVAIGVGNGTLEVRLLGMHASPYLPSGSVTVDPSRTRRLLLRRNQILSLLEKTKARGLTLIPLRLYLKRGWIKVEVGLVRGKKKWEKREVLKRRDLGREVERAHTV